MSFLVRLLVLGSLVATCGFSSATFAQNYRVPVGATHPDFQLPNVKTGEDISFSQYRGKKVLLVHFASW